MREFKGSDSSEILEILSSIQDAGDSYYFENLSHHDLMSYWLKPNFKCFVCEIDGNIAGSYILGANGCGRFSHTANASYIVSGKYRGLKIGKTLGEHSIELAKKLEYQAMQFNQVVSTNVVALKLWKSLGFRIIGTIPLGFNHKTLGLVDSHIMYKSL